LLDADGTLLDFHRAERHALDEIQRDLGIEDTDAFRETYHAVNAALWRAFEEGHLTAQQVREQRFREFLAKLQIEEDSDAISDAFLDVVVRETTFIDGASAVLEELNRYVRTVLLTNGFADVQRRRIARLGLEHAFDEILISEEVGVAKPDPAIFEIALERMGKPARDAVLMVGDSLTSDIAGGARMGIDTCWFNPDHQSNNSGVQPTYEISRLQELSNLVFATGDA
jgi:YjjG family noncanonical pyrimidine nucleotidase